MQVVAVMEPAAGSASVTGLNGASVRGAMEDFLTRSKGYRVVDRRRADQVFGELSLQRTSPMIDPATAKAIGKHLSADFVCVSEITKDEGHTNINISLIDVETGVVARSGSETVQGDGPADIRAATERIASRMTGVKTNEQMATQRTLRRNVTFGFYGCAGIPVGDFGGVGIPATPDFQVPQSQGYDLGFGARFTMTFPLLSQFLAFRAGAGFAHNGGSNTAPGYPDLDLGYLAIGASGELQFFFGESYQHRGTYIFGAAAINNETFYESDTSYTERRMRLGATAGLGHTFSARTGGGGLTVELAYHATLSGADAGGPVAADYIRLGVGYVF
jgi:TolB-like protein